MLEAAQEHMHHSDYIECSCCCLEFGFGFELELESIWFRHLKDIRKTGQDRSRGGLCECVGVWV